MATYVNDLRLKEIATGDEAGTWGTSTNTNLELIGEALGYGTQDCFSSDADATTTVADGATDPARAMYFKVTSSATLTAGRTLTIAPNTISRVMFIENATTGSQVITISQGTGGNVAIANGKTAVVYLDGAGSGAAVVDAMALVDPGITDTLAEVLVAGNTSSGTNIELTTTDKVQFRDSAIYLNSSADGQLDIVADTEVQIAATTIDINGNVDISGTAGIGGVLTANAGVVVDTITIDGSEIDASSSLTLDIGGNLTIDVDGSTITLADGGVNFGQFYQNASGQFNINAPTQDKDIVFLGNDGGSSITALTLDMSSAGFATFKSGAVFNEDSADSDFRVESNNNTHMLFVDAGNNRIGVNTSAPDQLVHIFGGNSGSAYTPDGADLFILENSDSAIIDIRTPAANSGGILFSDAGARGRGQVLYSHSTDALNFTAGSVGRLSLSGSDTIFNDSSTDTDFRVESNSNTHMLFVDGGSNQVHVATTGVGPSIFNVVNNMAITNTAGAQYLLMGNQDSAGVNNPNVIASGNGVLSFGNGDSWSSETGGTLTERFRIGSTEVVANESSLDQDFRVESNGNTHAIFVNAGADGVGFGATASTVGSSTIEGMYYEIGGSLTVASNTETLQINRNNTGGNNRVNIGLYNNGTKRGEIGTYGAADGMFFYTGSTVDSLRLTAGEAVFNDGGDDVNFRVESNNNQNMFFVDAGNDRIGVNTSSPSDAMVHVANDIDSASYRDVNSIIYNLNGSITEAQAREMFRITADSTRRSCQVRITFQAWSGGGISNMSGGSMTCSIWKADGDVSVRVEEIHNGSESSGSVSMMLPTVSGDIVTFGMRAGNNGTASTYTVNTRIELVSNTPSDFTVADYSAANATATGSHYNGGFLLAALDGSDELSFNKAGNRTLVVNEDSFDRDFRVESDSNANAFFLDGTNGNIGMGGTSNVPLNIFRNGAGNTELLRLTNNNTNNHNFYVYVNDDDNMVRFGSTGDNGGNFAILESTNTNDSIIFYTAGGATFNELGADSDFRVESDGNANMIFVDAGNNSVSIGTANDFTGMLNLSNAYGDYCVAMQDNENNTAFVLFRNNSGTSVGSILRSGTSTNYNTTSDARLKENIADADDAGELIDAIQVRQFDWITDGEHQRYGMVAQELNTVAPEAVSEGNTEEDMMGVDYSKLVPMLIKEIQSLRARVAQLESN